VSLENHLGIEFPAEPLGGWLLVVAFGMRRFRSERAESLFDGIKPRKFAPKLAVNDPASPIP
jgi:hypothetical protein